jgi:hypothetical protein
MHVTMPSDYDRRRLDEIEAALRASDPGLDRALRTFRPPRRTWPSILLGVAWVFAAGAGLTGSWVIMLIMLGPLLALTFLTLSARWSGSPSTHNGMYPPTWTRFWG